MGYLDFTEFEVTSYVDVSRTRCISQSVDMSCTSFCPTPRFLVVATANPPVLQTLHYALFTDEIHNLEQDETSELEHLAYLSELPWIVDPDSPIVDVQYNLDLDLYSLISSDGRAYAVKELSITTQKVSACRLDPRGSHIQ